MKRETDWFKILVCLAAAVACVPWSTYVMTVIWGWFVMPLGLPAISKAQAFGLMLLVSLCKSYETKESEDGIAEKIGVCLGGPALVLLMGYIAHSFMR